MPHHRNPPCHWCRPLRASSHCRVLRSRPARGRGLAERGEISHRLQATSREGARSVPLYGHDIPTGRSARTTNDGDRGGQHVRLQGQPRRVPVARTDCGQRPVRTGHEGQVAQAAASGPPHAGSTLLREAAGSRGGARAGGGVVLGGGRKGGRSAAIQRSPRHRSEGFVSSGFSRGPRLGFKMAASRCSQWSCSH